MKISHRIKKYTVVAVVLFFLAFLFWFSFLKTEQIFLKIDSCVSEDCKSKIRANIESHMHGKHDINKLKENLSSIFLPIKAISIDYLASGQAYVKISSFKPYLILEDVNKYYLTQNGLIVDQSFFDSFYDTLLNSIFVESLDELISSNKTRDLTEFALSIDQNLLNEFSVTWRSKTEILLVSKKYDKFHVLGDHLSLNKSNLLKHAEKIYLLKKHPLKMGLKVDIRFRDLIVSASLGEVNNEKKSRN